MRLIAVIEFFLIVWVNCGYVPQKNTEIGITLSVPELFNWFPTQI
jgi:hypothetical protein